MKGHSKCKIRPLEKNMGEAQRSSENLREHFQFQMEAQMYADASPDRIIWTCNMFNHAQSSINQAKALLLDDSEAPQIQKTFPELVKFMESKEFEAYVIIVNNLKPLDCTKDREQVFNTLKLMDMKKVMTTN